MRNRWSSKPSLQSLVTAVVVVVVLGSSGCRSKANSNREGGTAGSAAEGSGPPSSQPVAIDALWSRAEWLAAARAVLADPENRPRMGNATTGALFEKLVSTRPWLARAGERIDAQAMEETLAFFPVIKMLMTLYGTRGTVDEVVALSLFMRDVNEAFVAMGNAYIDGLPDDDTTKQVRREGLAKVQLGAAISVCGLFYTIQSASPAYQELALTKLNDPAWYAFLSRQGLQLTLATLDERVLPTIGASLKERLAGVRAVIAKVHAAYGDDSAEAERVVYEGIGSEADETIGPVSVVSHTGGFSVDLFSAALVKKVERKDASGEQEVQHWIELQLGDAKFEAVCMDGVSEQQLRAQFSSMDGVVAETSSHPGAWFTIASPSSEGRMRITTIDKRGCLASVQGPEGKVPTPMVEPFLLSLRAAP